MKLGCRIGLHSWGKWSEPWYMKYTSYEWGVCWDEYHIMRTLRCKHCNHEKNKQVDLLTKLGDRLKNKNQPTWV